MAEKVQILVETLDKASAPLKNVTKSIGGLHTGAVNLAAKLSIVSNGVNILGQALGTAQRIADQTIGSYIKYANAMQDGSRVTGIAIDQYSRLVQVGDDVRLSQEQLELAFTLASKKGIDVSIEGLQKLSAEYLSIESPMARVKFLTDTFGRSGADMARLLEMGADGIRDATSAIAGNLVVTEESARQAEAARLAQDNLEDSFTGLKNTIALGVVPTFTTFLDNINIVIGQIGKLKNVLKSHADEMADGTTAWNEYAFEMARAAYEAKQLSFVDARRFELMRDGNVTQRDYDKFLNQIIDDLGYYTAETLNAHRSQQGLNEMAADGIAYFGDLTPALSSAKGATDDLTDSEVNLANATNNAEAAMQGYTKQLLFKLASESLDAPAALQLAYAMGLVDEKTVMATEKVQNYSAMLQAGEIDLATYDALVTGLALHLDGLHDKTITVTYNQVVTGDDRFGNSNYHSNNPGTTVEGFASGGSFVIPPGYPNDSYPLGPGVRAQSGETVTVTPAGKSPAESGNVTYNLYVSSPKVDAQAVIYGYRTLQLMQEG